VKNERLFAIVNHLLAHGRTDAGELARRFEVTERTIYRDMDSLSGSGVPVLAVPGAGGGYEIAEGFALSRSFLTGAELADLTGALGGFAEALKSKPLERSLAKLAGLGSRSGRRGEDGQVRSGRAENRAARRAFPATVGSNGVESGNSGPSNREGAPAPPLVVTLTPWGGASPDASLVELLREAIAARRAVALVYRDSRGSSTERVVEPFSVVLGGAVWYLHAWCRLRGSFRLFRLSRVVEARVLDEQFDPWLRAPVPEPFSGIGDEQLVEVALEVQGSRLARLAEAFSGAAMVVQADGSARVSFRTPGGEWLESYVISLGPGVAVVQPAALREAVRRNALGVAKANRPTRRRNLTHPDRVEVTSSVVMEDRMSETMVAQCGIDCSKCPARIAFVKDDPELRRRTAEEWSKAYNAEVKPEDVFCSGCRVEGLPKIGHCGVCEVRRCGRARGVANCGECADYAGCETIAGFLKFIPDAKATLDAIRAHSSGQ
jgi:predicted DNA-binding transcriptional regulator YafY